MKDDSMMTETKPNRVLELEGRKKEIWEMAALMADEENPTDKEVALNLIRAKEVVDGIDSTMKWITGGVPRPNKKPFNEWINEWIEIAEQIKTDGDTYEEG